MYVIYFSFFGILNSQILQLRTVCKLPPELKESSGLISNNHGATFWSHNDSDGKIILYEIDSTCNLLRQVFIKNAINIDNFDLFGANGAIYIFKVTALDNNKPLRSFKTTPFEMNDIESIDIDTEEEFIISEKIWSASP